MSLYLGDKLIAGAGTPTLDTRNVGQIVQSAIPLTDAGLHLLDGALINGSGSYSAFVTYIAGLVSDYPGLFVTEADWQTSVTNYGVCGKFVYDSVNNTVRLPKKSSTERHLVKSTVSGNNWCDVYSDGWCEQGGYLGDTTFSTKTISLPVPYNDTNFTILTSVKNSSGAHNFRFTKNSSSSITFNRVGDSNCTGHWMTLGYTDISSYKVEPLYQYIVIANSTKTEIEVDIDEIATDLNGKADTDLANCTKPYVTETYVNGTSWYRVWSDGWCEQGSYTDSVGYDTNVTISFLRNFADPTAYSTFLNYFNTSTSDHMILHTIARTNSSFTIRIRRSENASSGTRYINWYACGYLA